MTEKEKMLAGELYDCGDAELLALWHRAKDLARDYNLTNSSDTKRKSELLNELLGKVGNQLWITPPFHVDYGCNIYFGNNCEVNMYKYIPLIILLIILIVLLSVKMKHSIFVKHKQPQLLLVKMFGLAGEQLFYQELQLVIIP